MFTFNSLLDSMQAHGDHIALLEVKDAGLAAHSFAAVAGRARALARGLLSAGVTRSATVGLFASNGCAWIVARLAIAACGAVAVSIDHQADAEEAGGIIRSSGLRFLLIGGEQLLAVGGQLSLQSIETIVIDDDVAVDIPVAGSRSWRSLSQAGPSQPLPQLDADEPAMLVYTSGTTGNPKAFFLRNRHIEANVRAIGAFGLVRPGDRLLLPLPLHHVYPFVVGLLVPLSVGATVVLPQAASGAKVVDALARGEATTMIGVPRLYEAMVAGLEGQARARSRIVSAVFSALLQAAVAVRRRFGLRVGRLLFAQVHRRLGPKLRLLVSAGAKLEAETLWKLEGLGFIALAGYGLAETASAFTGNVPGAQRIGTEGRPLLADGRIRIAEPDAAGAGEIQLHGASVFDGYVDSPDANRAAFTDDGWLRTGDLGQVDADGYLIVRGRLKEMIVLGGGKNVFPDELEKRYAADPAIREVAVLERQGALVALVAPDIEAIRKSANSGIEDVIRVALASVAKTLPSHERLSGFAISRQPLPRTRLGKYQRFLLPKLYEDAQAGRGAAPAKPLSEEDQALLEGARAAAAWRVLEQRYAARGISLDSDPQLDLGIDSMEWLSLGLELEGVLGITLAEQDFADVHQVRDLLRLVEAKPASAGDAVEPAAERLTMDEERWLSPATPAENAAGAVFYAINRLLARVVFRLRIEGIEHLPAGAPFVIVANHASDLDPPLLGAALPLSRMRRLYWSGDRGRLFGRWWSRPLCRVAHIFPVDERAPGATLAMAGRALARGHVLVWFPESWRTPDGRLQRFLPGIGRLLSEHPVAAVPAFIAGTFDAMPRERSWPRPHPVTITFGPPMDVAAQRAAGEGEAAYATIAEALRERVERLEQASRRRT